MELFIINCYLQRDELMARRGIEKGTTLVNKSSKMGLSMNLPGIGE